MDKISLIIPVYNVEKYLDKCIDSVIKQTYQNIEIILVDDGSTDNSGKICDEYQKKDSRIIVIHKKNGGLSSARNAGIDIANGSYIGFIDSDDYIKNDMYEVLYTIIKKDNADLAMCKLVDCYESIETIKRQSEPIQEFLLSREETVKIVMEAKNASVSAVNKLYKKSIFADGLRYTEGKTAEDALIIIELILKCKKISITTAEEYYYFHREDSITTKKFNPKSGYDIIEAYEKNYNLIKANFPKLTDIAKMRLCWANFYVLQSMITSNYNIDMSIVKYLRKNLKFILKNDCFTKKRKISMIVLKISLPMYKILINEFYKRNRRLYK